LYVASITEHNASLQKVKLFNRIKLSLCTNERPQYATEFGQFCHGEPQNFVNWLVEFSKIFHGKLWP